MISRNLAFLVEYLDLPRAVGEDGANWEQFQLEHLNNRSVLAIDVKSRQAGESWLFSAESVADAILNPKTPHIFVSVNKVEAAEKIRYAKDVMEALDAEVRPKLIVDNRFTLEFQNGSRLISHPCRPVRGTAKARVYLDEFAHYPNDDEIYQSVMPVLTKGGAIRIGSSPFGARGKFWEIYTESVRSYSGYVRRLIPWWVIGGLCSDLDEAKKLSPHMSTEERVALFGSERLILIYENMPLSDFQQEYECEWLDESVSWIDWDLIQRNQDLASQDKLLYYKSIGEDDAIQAIDELAAAVRKADVEQVFFGGVDIGRYKDTTDLILVGENEMYNQLPYRLGITLDRVPFDNQQKVIDYAMRSLPIAKLLIDKNGIGSQMAETSEKNFPDRAQGVVFTNGSKSLWAVEVKLKAQRGQVPIPIERDFMYQIHSIKKKPTAGGKTSFDTGKGTKGHHADMFWAWALAVYAGRSDGTSILETGASPTAGYRG